MVLARASGVMTPEEGGAGSGGWITSIAADLFESCSKETVGVVDESAGVCQNLCSANLASALMMIVQVAGL